MRTTTLITMWIVRLAGIIQIVLGLLFWTGRALSYIPFHINNGFLVVLGLWTLAILTFIARGRPALGGFALFWGLALPAFGMVQMTILVGPWHWVIRVVHLLMGIIALGVADTLAAHVLRVRPRAAR